MTILLTEIAPVGCFFARRLSDLHGDDIASLRVFGSLDLDQRLVGKWMEL